MWYIYIFNFIRLCVFTCTVCKVCKTRCRTLGALQVKRAIRPLYSWLWYLVFPWYRDSSSIWAASCISSVLDLAKHSATTFTPANVWRLWRSKQIGPLQRRKKQSEHMLGERFTVIFTNDLFITATSIWDREQQTERIQLILPLDMRLAQNLQKNENTSVLQKLTEVIITKRLEKHYSVKKRWFDDNMQVSLTHWATADRKIPTALSCRPKEASYLYLVS